MRFWRVFDACWKRVGSVLEAWWKRDGSVIEVWLKRDWSVIEAWLKRDWSVVAAYLKRDWSVIEAYLKLIWSVIEACLKRDWSLVEAYLKLTWRMLAIWNHNLCTLTMIVKSPRIYCDNDREITSVYCGNDHVGINAQRSVWDWMKKSCGAVFFSFPDFVLSTGSGIQWKK